jgi:hypothetical protein
VAFCEAEQRFLLLFLEKEEIPKTYLAYVHLKLIVDITLFFLKKEPKTLALRGFNSLSLLLFFKELKITGFAGLEIVDPCLFFLKQVQRFEAS